MPADDRPVQEGWQSVYQSTAHVVKEDALRKTSPYDIKWTGEDNHIGVHLRIFKIYEVDTKAQVSGTCNTYAQLDLIHGSHTVSRHSNAELARSFFSTTRQG